MKKGVCKLCGRHKELLSRSHIIPDFFYKEMYDEHHKIQKLKIHPDKTVVSYLQRISTGEYEAHILCAKCDNEIIGGYEDYVAKMLYNIEALPIEKRPSIDNFKNDVGLPFSILKNIDYAKFKLFILSMLWRASISTRENFNKISLHDLEEEVRVMILNNNPKEASVFPMIFFGWFFSEEIPTGIISQPLTAVEKNGWRFIFPIKGLVFNIFSSIEDISPDYRGDILKENGEFTMVHTTEDLSLEFLRNYYG